MKNFGFSLPEITRQILMHKHHADSNVKQAKEISIFKKILKLL